MPRADIEALVPEFVTTVPEKPLSGVLYVSIEFATAVHLCCCGCGNEVVTPLSRTRGWKMLFDGETVTLHPSIGNWSFPCRSHYFIRENRVDWVPATSPPISAMGSNQTSLAAPIPHTESMRAKPPGWLTAILKRIRKPRH